MSAIPARSWLHQPVVHVLAAVVVMVAAGVVATVLAPTERGPGVAVSTVVPVSETLVACPGLRSRRGYTESTVAAGTPPSLASADPTESGSGTVRTLTRNPANDKSLIRLKAPGDVGSYTGRNGEDDSVTGAAEGAFAPGFSVTQTERTVDGKGRGLASTQCLPTGSSFWFVGAASGVGQRAVLVLTNPESATATVDVALYGRSGPVDAPAARGIVVPARSRVEIRLDEVAPGQPVLALNVQVRVGRLSAAVTETDVFGFEPRGTDWIPSAVEPDTHLVVPGFPTAGQSRDGQLRLDVAAPRDPAVVTVRLITADGTFSPEGLGVVDVPAGGVKSVDLTKAFDGQSGSVVVESDVPVVAGARVFLADPDQFGDSLYLAASAPVTAPAVVPDNRTTQDLSTRLIVSAPDRAATLTVKAFAGGQTSSTGGSAIGRPTTIDIPAGETRQVTIVAGKQEQQFGLVITPGPGSGPVYGVRMLDEAGPRGPLVTSLPLRTARLLATVPVAVPNIEAGTTR